MDRRQFIKYVESHQKALRRFLTALCCGDSFLADDLAQDTLLKAYLACNTFREESAFSSWLFRIAYNTFISDRRRMRAEASIEEISDLPAKEQTDSIFEYHDLHVALARIPETERTTILLFYMQGYALKEIAEITGLTPAAAKQALYRGRLALKKLIDR